MLVAEMMTTPLIGDDTAMMFLPGAIIQSCVCCILQCRVRLHRAVKSTIPQNKTTSVWRSKVISVL